MQCWQSKWKKIIYDCNHALRWMNILHWSLEERPFQIIGKFWIYIFHRASGCPVNMNTLAGSDRGQQLTNIWCADDKTSSSLIMALSTPMPLAPHSRKWGKKMMGGACREGPGNGGGREHPTLDIWVALRGRWPGLPYTQSRWKYYSKDFISFFT